MSFIVRAMDIRMKKWMSGVVVLFLTLFSVSAVAQNFTSYLTGNENDIETLPLGGVCMMGGAGEHDEAMRWFLNRANGGDVLVLRTSGSNGYNNYMYNQLGVKINSVETIVCKNKQASTDNYLIQKIRMAEAIWFAGGDQYDYVSYWRDTPVSREINKAIKNHNIVIGGTSAGMAILGEYYFSARNGSVSSEEALNNPYLRAVTVDTTLFLTVPYMGNVITDTHYDDPDRRGRHTTFLARIANDYYPQPLGVACNEYVAVCIDENGKAIVYGDYPKYDEFAYFIRLNCTVDNNVPEICEAGKPLTWNQNGTALTVYRVPGTNEGKNTFDMRTWQGGSGGSWFFWSVDNGVLVENSGTEVDCLPVSTQDDPLASITLFPNPTYGQINVYAIDGYNEIRFYDVVGQLVLSQTLTNNQLDITSFSPGVYWLEFIKGNQIVVRKKIVKL